MHPSEDVPNWKFLAVASNTRTFLRTVLLCVLCMFDVHFNGKNDWAGKWMVSQHLQTSWVMCVTKCLGGYRLDLYNFTRRTFSFCEWRPSQVGYTGRDSALGTNTAVDYEKCKLCLHFYQVPRSQTRPPFLSALSENNVNRIYLYSHECIV